MFHSRGDRDLGVAFQTHPGRQASSRGKQRTPLSSRVAPGISWTQLSGLKGVNPPVKFGEKTRDCSPGQAGIEGPHFSLTGASCGFSRVAAAFSSYDGDLSLPLGLALGPIPPSIRVFSNESTLCLRWPKYCSFSFMKLDRACLKLIVPAKDRIRDG